MCNTCGCGNVTRHSHDHHHDHPHGHDHSHDHDHHHEHDHESAGEHWHGADGSIHYGAGPARLVAVGEDILAHNNRIAADNRAWFAAHGVLALNLVSSPGSGKTSLLCRTVAALGGRTPVAVIEGDQQTSFDADRIRALGVPAVQINTGKGCHLDARMIGHAVRQMGLPQGATLFIENVGNLVCPAGFDLGEAAKVVILSVTEGEDKPLKYPDMFAAAAVMLLNKTDLLPHLDFDVERCLSYARRVNPAIAMLPVSAVSGEGLQGWYDWIAAHRPALQPAAAD